MNTQSLVGLPVDADRPWITFATVRDVGDHLLIAVRIESTKPGLPSETRWMRCVKADAKLVRWLVSARLDERDDARVADIVPPPGEPCGGWLAPDGRLW